MKEVIIDGKPVEIKEEPGCIIDIDLKGDPGVPGKISTNRKEATRCQEYDR